MPRLTLILLSLIATASSGCRFANPAPEAYPSCGETCISREASSPECGERACSPAGASESRWGEFGLFGPIFCDPRLSEGTAFWPWQYAYNLCLSTSQFSNTVLGGDPDESLSSRFGRAQQDGVLPVRYGLAPFTNFLVGPDHCRRCIEHDLPRNKELWSW